MVPTEVEGVGVKVAIAFLVSGIASLVGVTSPIWAQVTTDPTVTTWAPAGSAAVAVSALAYGARKLARGEIVPLNIAEVIQSNQRVIETVTRMAEHAHDREAALRDTVVANTQALTAMTTTLGVIAEQGRPTPRKRTPKAGT